MPLTKDQKTEVLGDILGVLQEASTLYLTDYKGLTVAQANDLRSRFRKSGIEYKVIKNTLLRLAMEQLGGYDELFDHLHGPTAVAFSNEPSAPARVIKDFLRATAQERPELKAAYVDGAVYSGNQLDVLASLKSKEELIGEIIGLLLSPIANVVGALQAPGQTLAGALQTIAEKEGQA